MNIFAKESRLGLAVIAVSLFAVENFGFERARPAPKSSGGRMPREIRERNFSRSRGTAAPDLKGGKSGGRIPREIKSIPGYPREIRKKNFSRSRGTAAPDLKGRKPGGRIPKEIRANQVSQSRPGGKRVQKGVSGVSKTPVVSSSLEERINKIDEILSGLSVEEKEEILDKMLGRDRYDDDEDDD